LQQKSVTHSGFEQLRSCKSGKSRPSRCNRVMPAAVTVGLPRPAV
jgi:hypothetical protein